MPPRNMEKALIGLAGAAGAGILAWQTQFPWIKYDLQIVKAGSKLVKVRDEMANTFLIDKFESHAAAQPHKAMVIFEEGVYTYGFMEEQANRVANMVRRLGLKVGDTVALMVRNEPAFIWTFLGLQKLGIEVALINFNLRLKQLTHSILATEPKALFLGKGDDLLQAVGAVLDDLRGLPVYVQGLSPGQVPTGMQNFDQLMQQALPVRLDRSVRDGVNPTSTMCYIYTSGTTGLPKPVFVSQQRASFASLGTQLVNAQPDDVLYTTLPLYHSSGGALGFFSVIFTGLPKPAFIKQMKGSLMSLCSQLAGLSEDDILYTCLPLYHSSGGALGLFSIITFGCTMVLREKFSASHYWADCRKHNVTIIQYIGEIFRYLLSLPPNELDAVHNVKAAFGNGLRKDIFEAVLKRYKIPLICEFFGATEGTSLLFNIANKPGAIGRVSPLLNLVDPDPKYLVKCDYVTATPIRDRNGRCIRVKPGEPGLFISRVPEMVIKDGSLTVYKASREANEKKLVHGAFKEGDLYFNYGDVMTMDKDYFVYFHDRIGDTFRWKGENVSTTEVANVLSSLDFIEDANVYGVMMPGHDGRAGMAALTLRNGKKPTPQQLKQIYKLCEVDLPTYARPLFLRLLPEAVLTATFKQRKVELVEEGYDLTKVKDDLYYLDVRGGTYSPLTGQGLASFLQSKL